MARHNDFGKKGEEAARDVLLRNGYIIRETNWRCDKYEIDIVAEKDTRLIVVEVQTRTSPINDLTKVITKKKIANIINAGKAYLAMNKLPYELQFDIILQIGEADDFETEHIEDAIIPPLKTY